MRKLLFLLLLLLSLSFAGSGQLSPGYDWTNWNFLIGEWLTGSSNGLGTTGTGWISFSTDLGGKILVRKNHAEYPAHKAKPGAVHDDLTIVYWDGGIRKAFYDDNDGHVVHYDVTVSPDKKKIIFESEKNAPGQHYRLTYEAIQTDLLKLTYENAPANKPDQFLLYTEALAHRKSPALAATSKQP
jgi:hypothetical protein